MTNYLTVRGEKTAFPGAKGVDVWRTSATARRTRSCSSRPPRPCRGRSPTTFRVDEKNPKAGCSGLRPGGFIAAFCDGSVRFIHDSIDADVLKALFTRNGGEVSTSTTNSPPTFKNQTVSHTLQGDFSWLLRLPRSACCN